MYVGFKPICNFCKSSFENFVGVGRTIRRPWAVTPFGRFIEFNSHIADVRSGLVYDGSC